jgi:hypothetical protein
MTESLFFDSDCISAFLWVNEQNLLTLLYPGRIVIPKPAYDEMSFPTTPHLKQRIDLLIANKQATIEAILYSGTFTSLLSYKQKTFKYHQYLDF